MDVMDRLNAAIAAPKTHRVIITYANGKVRKHDCRNAMSAETFATGERRKVGRDLIDRQTRETVRVVAVSIEPIQ